MQTQHKIELDERDKNPGMVPSMVRCVVLMYDMMF
jgi:hypothetical protein